MRMAWEPGRENLEIQCDDNAQIYPSIGFRGIKIFFPNRWEQNGHFDKPPMTVDEIFGVKNAPGARRIASKPNVVIIA